MCGIAGFVGREPGPEALPRMLARVAHRGPDGEGAWHSRQGPWHVAFGHRRLAVIDLAAGTQPLGTADARITFNGEIYNYRELRATLPETAFATASDTEVLFALLRKKGAAEALPLLNGMFAFAFWHDGALVLARDRSGVKPLYYTELAGGGLAFASELGALLEHPEVKPVADPAALAEFFFLDYAHAPRSMIRGVKKLPPGTFVAWRNGVTSPPRPYSAPGAAPAPRGPKREAALAGELRERLALAVERELVSDVPVGVLLSGGLDSSLVAALACRRRPGSLRSFAVGFEDPAFDESAFSRAAARALGTEHTERIFRERDLPEILRPALDSLDEPLADPSLLPTYLLARTAAAHVKVALSGDGGDELWAGYPTYRAARLAGIYGRIPEPLRRPVRRLAAALPSRGGYQSLEWKLKRFALRWDDDPLLRHFRWMSSVDLPELPRLSRGFAAGLEDFWRPLRDVRDPDPLNRELKLDYLTYLPGSVLAKVDRAAMAHGLEVRPPFLDPDFVDWSFSLPSRLKLRNGRSKYLLKRAALAVLPAEIVHRRKRGFAVPLARWLRGPLAEAVSGCLRGSPVWELLDREPFLAWHEEHRAGRADRSRPLWALLVLDHWARRFNVGPG